MCYLTYIVSSESVKSANKTKLLCNLRNISSQNYSTLLYDMYTPERYDSTLL